MQAHFQREQTLALGARSCPPTLAAYLNVAVVVVVVVVVIAERRGGLRVRPPPGASAGRLPSTLPGSRHGDGAVPEPTDTGGCASSSTRGVRGGPHMTGRPRPPCAGGGLALCVHERREVGVRLGPASQVPVHGMKWVTR